MDLGLMRLFLGDELDSTGAVYTHTARSEMPPPVSDEEVRRMFCDEGIHICSASTGRCRYCDFPGES